MLEDGSDLPESIEDVNGTLTFKNVTADHKGHYTCQATNTQGEISATVQITIVVAPRYDRFNNRFVLHNLRKLKSLYLTFFLNLLDLK